MPPFGPIFLVTQLAAGPKAHSNEQEPAPNSCPNENDSISMGRQNLFCGPANTTPASFGQGARAKPRMDHRSGVLGQDE